jgi:hypothetical protein
MEINGLTTHGAFAVIENAMSKINAGEDANCIFFGSDKDSAKGYGYVNFNAIHGEPIRAAEAAIGLISVIESMKQINPEFYELFVEMWKGRKSSSESGL